MPPLSQGQLLSSRFLMGHSLFSQRPLTSLSHQLIPNPILLVLFPTDLPIAGLLSSALFSCQAPTVLFSQSPTLFALVVPSKQLPRKIPSGPYTLKRKRGGGVREELWEG